MGKSGLPLAALLIMSVLRTTDRKKQPLVGAEEFIEFDREMFSRTTNPLYAWQAYREARADGLPIPEWVLDYLDRSAEEIRLVQRRMLGNREKRSVAVAVAESFGFKKPGRSGRGNVFGAFNRFRWVGLGVEVHAEVTKPGDPKLYLAVEEVAERNKVSESSVWRALSRYEAEFVAPSERLYFRK